MARDELRAGFIVSACVVAGVGGVLVGQPVPGATEEDADEVQEARAAEELAREAEEWAAEAPNEGLREVRELRSEEAEEFAREQEADIVAP